MTDRPFLQVNLKVGNMLLNGYADSAEEFLSILDIFNEKLGDCATLDAAATAAATVACTLAGGSTSPGRGSAPSSTPSSTSPGPHCEHGAKQYRTGTSKRTGKGWKAWDCPVGICDRQFVN